MRECPVVGSTHRTMTTDQNVNGGCRSDFSDDRTIEALRSLDGQAPLEVGHHVLGSVQHFRVLRASVSVAEVGNVVADNQHRSARRHRGRHSGKDIVPNICRQMKIHDDHEIKCFCWTPGSDVCLDPFHRGPALLGQRARLLKALAGEVDSDDSPTVLGQPDGIATFTAGSGGGLIPWGVYGEKPQTRVRKALVVTGGPIRRVVIVGGVAGGMSTATRLRRLDVDASITVIERSGHVSFANCGLPYFVGGLIEEEDDLTLQTPDQLFDRFRLDVRVNDEVIAIDRVGHTVTTRSTLTAEESVIAYDKLVLSMGAAPVRPAIPGYDRVRTLRTVEDAARLASDVEGGADERRCDRCRIHRA